MSAVLLLLILPAVPTTPLGGDTTLTLQIRKRRLREFAELWSGDSGRVCLAPLVGIRISWWEVCPSKGLTRHLDITPLRTKGQRLRKSLASTPAHRNPSLNTLWFVGGNFKILRRLTRLEFWKDALSISASERSWLTFDHVSLPGPLRKTPISEGSCQRAGRGERKPFSF